MLNAPSQPRQVVPEGGRIDQVVTVTRVLLTQGS